jgi:hypothetical protein
MAKKSAVAEPKVEEQVSSNGEVADGNEVIENLKAQYQEYTKAAEEARTMALKALGALEVLTSLKEHNKE